MDTLGNYLSNLISNVFGTVKSGAKNVAAAPGKIKSGLGQMFGGGELLNPVGGTNVNQDLSMIGNVVPQTPAPTPAPVVTPTATPTQAYRRDAEYLQPIIQSGLSQFASGSAPISTMSAELAQAGEKLSPNIDPLLPVILSLMESRGLLDKVPAERSNPYNIISNGGVVNYPDPQTAILGGGDKLGLLGLLREGGLYQDFADSGNLSDFFRRFTPSSDPLNPSTDQLVERYQILRKLFE